MPPEAVAALAGVREAIAIILEYTTGRTKQDYLRDKGLRAIVERQFITVGEAMTRLRSRHSEIFATITEAPQIIYFRNLLVHGYDVIDHDRVWLVVEKHVPILKREVDALMIDYPPITEP